MFAFRLNPQPTDFAALADHISKAPQDNMHAGLWEKREAMIQRLRAVVERGAVEEADRSIYNAMRLLVY